MADGHRRIVGKTLADRSQIAGDLLDELLELPILYCTGPEFRGQRAQEMGVGLGEMHAARVASIEDSWNEWDKTL